MDNGDGDRMGRDDRETGPDWGMHREREMSRDRDMDRGRYRERGRPRLGPRGPRSGQQALHSMKTDPGTA